MKSVLFLMAAAVIFLIAAVIFLIYRLKAVQKNTDILLREREYMEHLNEQTQKLAHHQRLETIGTLTSSIAHEFNNLLTPILGYSLMALEKISPEETELFDEILKIYESGQKAKEIVSRLSDLSRKNPDASDRAISVDEVIRKTLDIAMAAKPQAVEIRLNLNCWDQRIQANEIQLMQMFLNLILNGFHAMEEQGGQLRISTTFDEKRVRIRIADTGCGIPEKILPHIYEPFFSTKKMGSGTGLGLAIVAQVVESHQGEIRVETEMGQGTAFFIDLPRILSLNS